MGDVYRATDTVLGRPVAIKVLPPAFAFDAERRARLEREARALAALNHPRIAHVYGQQAIPDGARTGDGVRNGLVMELVEGVTLTTVLRQGLLAIDDALRFGAERYAGGHDSVAMHPDLMREILDWFDKYLGPVDQRP